MDPSTLKSALSRAPERPAAATERPERELFVFTAGTLTFGVDSSHVREVTRLGPVTPLPRSPAFVLGAFGHRGEVLPVLDLLRFLSQGEAKAQLLRTRLFIGVGEGYATAFVTDGIAGLKRILRADIAPAPAGGSSEFLSGVVKTPEVGLIHLLELPRVIQAARQKAVAR